MRHGSFIKRTKVSHALAVLFACFISSTGPWLTRSVRAEETKVAAARITAMEPAALVRGGKVTFKLRGFKLKEATELKFPAANGLTVPCKETGDAAPAKGLDNQQVGDTHLIAELTVPDDLPTGWLDYMVVTPTGEVHGKVLVLAPDMAVDEKEPNDAFRAPQAIGLGGNVRGSIQSDKDVDVFALPVQAGRPLRVTVTSGGPLLMDAELTCYDLHGQFLVANDDQQTRDPVVTLTTKVDGIVLLCVSSAHDVGGPWQSYLLSVEEIK